VAVGTHSGGSFGQRQLLYLDSLHTKPLSLCLKKQIKAIREELRFLAGRDGKKKLKCTLVQALRLCTVRTAHRGSRAVALHFLDHGTRRG